MDENFGCIVNDHNTKFLKILKSKISKFVRKFKILIVFFRKMCTTHKVRERSINNKS